MLLPDVSGPCSIADVETTIHSRFLKMLERCMHAGEDLDLFKVNKAPEIHASSSPSTKNKVSKKLASDLQVQSQPPVVGDEPRVGANVDAAEPHSVTYADLGALARTLELEQDPDPVEGRLVLVCKVTIH
jgi:cohesin loading factor subunit SCC2